MQPIELSILTDDGGLSQVIPLGGASAASAVITGGGWALVSPTVDVFVRQGSGAAPVAVNNGTDIFLFGGSSYRCSVRNGNRLAFITTGATGTVYITPGV